MARGAARLLRRPLSAGADATWTPTGQKDTLFVYDEPGAWITYRCDHQAEQLEYLGRSADIVRSGRADLAAAVDHFDVFILNRVRWSERVAAFVDAARSADKRVIFGTDDLIFEPDFYRQFAFLDGAPESVREAWRDALGDYRRTMVACDAAIVSTEPLARHARQLVDRVDVVHNVVSSEMIRRADEAVGEAGASAGDVTIGYLSGTPSHKRDFREAADAVLWALDTYPNVFLRIIGKLELDGRFERFERRITRIPKQPFDAYLPLIAHLDINLAPLEPGNRFTECKSCAKYLEAGLFGVPTIASAQPDFVRVIGAGDNGFLVTSPEDWREALKTLIESPERRRTIGGLAYEDVRTSQSTKAGAPELEHALAG